MFHESSGRADFEAAREEKRFGSTAACDHVFIKCSNGDIFAVEYPAGPDSDVHFLLEQVRKLKPGLEISHKHLYYKNNPVGGDQVKLDSLGVKPYNEETLHLILPDYPVRAPDSQHLRIQFLDKEIFHVTYAKTDTILAVKENIFAKEPSMPVEKQTLRFHTTNLEDQHTLAHYGVNKENILLLNLQFETFATSHFKRLYPSEPLDFQHKLLGAVHDLLMAYCAQHGLDPKHAVAFFQRLEREAFQHKDELLGELDAAAQRLWTSASQLQGCGNAHAKEFCSILNGALRGDGESGEALLRPAALLARSINQLCITRRPPGAAGKGMAAFPPEGGVSFRGASLPTEHHAWYTVGKKYRVPGFLATSVGF
jgi:hypothetical protein